MPIGSIGSIGSLSSRRRGSQSGAPGGGDLPDVDIVIGGYGNLYVSTDGAGVEWTQIVTGNQYFDRNGVSFQGDKAMALWAGGFYTADVSDLVSWSGTAQALGSTYGIASSDTATVYGTSSGPGYASRTTNGATYVDGQAGGDYVLFTPIHVGGTEFFAFNRESKLLFSDDDGVTWTVFDIGIPSVYQIADVAHDGAGHFVAVAYVGGYHYSTRIVIRLQRVGNSLTVVGETYDSGFWTFHGIAYGKGRFVAVGLNGQIAYSDDLGVTWTHLSVTTQHMRGVRFGGGRWWAIGQEGPMQMSLDGETWTPIAHGATWYTMAIAVREK